jgi:predicted molibdopterin-dependent oxidoreductase YjgC
MIHLTINDQPIEVAEGRTLLEACRAHGIRVPTLCYHPALEPYGACRLCMVEVSQRPHAPRLVASCTYPCEEGAVVWTDTDEVRRSRRITAELLLAGASHLRKLWRWPKAGVQTARFKMPRECLRAVRLVCAGLFGNCGRACD